MKRALKWEKTATDFLINRSRGWNFIPDFKTAKNKAIMRVQLRNEFLKNESLLRNESTEFNS